MLLPVASYGVWACRMTNVPWLIVAMVKEIGALPKLRTHLAGFVHTGSGSTTCIMRLPAIIVLVEQGGFVAQTASLPLPEQQKRCNHQFQSRRHVAAIPAFTSQTCLVPEAPQT